MTEDMRDINSTRFVQRSPDADKQQIRENFFAEVLMSLIITISLLSVVMAIKGFSEYITITAYPQYLTLILAAAHTYIRRKWPKLLPCFLLHIASSVIFFFIMILIPFTGFGDGKANMFYLGVIILVYTAFSYSYRLNPTFSPSSSHIVAFPACIFPICGIFYVMMGNRTELFENLIMNTIVIAVLFLVMRQIAVFDAKYYHSIRRSSRPVKYLKRQNNLTALALIGVFAVSLVILKFIPVSVLSDLIKKGLLAIIPAIIKIILWLLDLFSSFFQETESANGEGEELFMLDGPLKDEPWFRVLTIIIAILILIVFVLMVLNTLRLLILNAPRYGKSKETSNDGNIVDTIEELKPEKTSFFTKRRDFGKGYERRIRKQFYEKTNRAMKKGLPVHASSTPGQIEKVLTANGDSEFPELRQEYEKVRYGK